MTDRNELVPADINDLVEAALYFDLQDNPGLRVRPYIRKLDAWAADLRTALAGAKGRDAVSVMVNFMDRNVPCEPGYETQMHDVIGFGSGRPMLIAALWVSVAQRAGLEAYGLDIPGRFMARIEGAIIDVCTEKKVISMLELDEYMAEEEDRARKEGLFLFRTKAGDNDTLVDRPVMISDFLQRLNMNLIQRHERLLRVAQGRDKRFAEESQKAWGFA
jgi:hypothetical protein